VQGEVAHSGKVTSRLGYVRSRRCRREARAEVWILMKEVSCSQVR
jgi:hypothetical protein